MATDPAPRTADPPPGLTPPAGAEVTYTARAVFPVAGPPLLNGTLTVRGDRVTAVEPHSARTPDADLGNVALIPGLVNAHTHLDLSGARGVVPPADAAHFTDWLRGVIAFRRARPPEQVQADVRAGLAEALAGGTTLLGDVTADGASWGAVAAAPVRAVVFREMIGLSEARARAAWDQAVAWSAATPDTPDCRKGLSPHAPYSAHRMLFTAPTAVALTTHLAESPGEMELLRARTGPFVDFLRAVGAWDESGVADLDDLLTVLRDTGQYLFAHANYLPPDAVRFLAGRHAVAYCPRTHAAFGHPPHPVRELLARGVRVCLGTDSLASNPDLDVLAEARFVRARRPDVPAAAVLRMVTLAGAEALGWADEAGSLEPGKSADAVAVPLPDRDAADPHELLFEDHPGPRRTLFRGAWRG